MRLEKSSKALFFFFWSTHAGPDSKGLICLSLEEQHSWNDGVLLVRISSFLWSSWRVPIFIFYFSLSKIMHSCLGPWHLVVLLYLFLEHSRAPWWQVWAGTTPATSGAWGASSWSSARWGGRALSARRSYNMPFLGVGSCSELWAFSGWRASSSSRRTRIWSTWRWWRGSWAPYPITWFGEPGNECPLPPSPHPIICITWG